MSLQRQWTLVLHCSPEQRIHDFIDLFFLLSYINGILFFFSIKKRNKTREFLHFLIIINSDSRQIKSFEF